ncbi:MAG: IS1595 family transposase [Rhodospirillales bacterium]|nr:IS1595 family transposase [Rhodospirillales bacterium]
MAKQDRKEISLPELYAMFPDEDAAEQWFIETRWPDGKHCPKCGSHNVADNPTRKPLPYRCRDCRRFFSVKTGSVMHGSRLSLRTWALAIYLMNTSVKGVSSLKLRDYLGVTQKTAWFLAHRIRETFDDAEGEKFAGPVEVDETYVGGKFKTMHAKDRRRRRLEPKLGKSIVVGAKDRATNQVTARVVGIADANTLEAFIYEVTTDDAEVYTDEAKVYGRIFWRQTVQHRRGQYVDGDVHINGIEGFWAMLKRAYKGTFHKMSEKHLQRYVTEFAGRHNARDCDTADQMAGLVAGMRGKRLRYEDLIADNGLSSGARK